MSSDRAPRAPRAPRSSTSTSISSSSSFFVDLSTPGVDKSTKNGGRGAGRAARSWSPKPRAPKPRALTGVVAAAAAVALGGLAACGGGGGDGTAIDRGPTTSEVTGPVDGGTLRLAVERPPTLDPARARPVPQSDLVLADLLFDGLTAVDAGTASVVPALAERWEPEDGGRVWVFHLRAGATFASGAPVTAADVKRTLERVAEDAPESPSAVLLEVVTGYGPVAAGDTGELAGVTAPDERTVRIELDEPLATLPEVLANPRFGVLPAATPAAGDAAFDPAAAASGPFSLDEAGDQQLRLSARTDANVHVDGVDVALHDDVAAAYAAFDDGQADWALAPTEAAADAAARHGDDAFAPFSFELFYAFNLRHPDLADVRFREAIVRSVDRRAIDDEVYDGTLLPLAGVVVRGLPGHADDPCGGRCDHDLARARQLVAEVFPDGGVPEVAIDFDEGDRQQEVAQRIADGLQAAGIPAVLRPHPFDGYDELLASGEAEVFRLGWSGGYPSAGAFLAPLFLSGSPDNVMGYESEAADEAIAAARAELDADERAAAFADAERRIMGDMPVVPIGQFQTLAVTSERVRDLRHSLLGPFDVTTVWLAPDG